MLDKIRCRITTDATTPRRRMSQKGQRAKGSNPLKLQRLDQKQNGVAACRKSEQAKPSTKTDNQILYISKVKKSCEKTQMTTKKKICQNDQKQGNRNTQRETSHPRWSKNEDRESKTAVNYKVQT